MYYNFLSTNAMTSRGRSFARQGSVMARRDFDLRQSKQDEAALLFLSLLKTGRLLLVAVRVITSHMCHVTIIIDLSRSFHRHLFLPFFCVLQGGASHQLKQTTREGICRLIGCERLAMMKGRDSWTSIGVKGGKNSSAFDVNVLNSSSSL